MYQTTFNNPHGWCVLPQDHEGAHIDEEGDEWRDVSMMGCPTGDDGEEGPEGVPSLPAPDWMRQGADLLAQAADELTLTPPSPARPMTGEIHYLRGDSPLPPPPDE